ncbi:hypothetical protein EG68_07029 [Paragonimus skrjabini miyazakii]|uniref:Rhodanese domain-containing protein n=1 Tax=Paragonimus skrjabini miyazakii TaxID=59628 RepID=A0A8S9YMM5_9TREM|nr:hypothetical protein EG68_07029 [Paragonimus skrjabini miyazakii]
MVFINVTQLKQMNKTGGVMLCDVRTREEVVESGLIPGAVNIPLSELNVVSGLQGCTNAVFIGILLKCFPPGRLHLVAEQSTDRTTGWK